MIEDKRHAYDKFCICQKCIEFEKKLFEDIRREREIIKKETTNARVDE